MCCAWLHKNEQCLQALRQHMLTVLTVLIDGATYTVVALQ